MAQNNSRIAQGFTSIGGGGGDSPLLASKTYAELTAMVAANELTVGYYLLTDFATTYDRPDFVDNLGTIEPAAVITTVTAATEPLILFAVADNSFAPNAYSPSNPSDIILYEFAYTTPINSAATTGRIIYRQDTVQNVECSFDFRTITFKFYDHADGLGYAWYYDSTGTDASDIVPPFQDYSSVSEFHSIPVPAVVLIVCQGFDLPNFTIKISALGVVGAIFNTSFNDVTAIATNGIQNSVIGINFSNNSIPTINDSVIGDNFYYNNLNLINNSIIGANANGLIGYGINNEDLSAATIIYGQSCVISQDANGVKWVTYTTILGAQVTTLITT